MWKIIFLTIFCFTATSQQLVANNQFFERSVKKQDIRHYPRKKGDDYKIAEVDCKFSWYLHEDDLCIDIELPEGIEVPDTYKFYQNNKSCGIYIDTKITNCESFLDSKGYPLTSYELIIDMVNSSNSAKLKITSVTKVNHPDSKYVTEHKREKTFSRVFENLLVDTSFQPELTSYIDIDQLGTVKFKIIPTD